MMLLKKHASLIIGVMIGGVAGYAYYYWIGCTSGNCAITSQPLNSTLYGALMGGLMVNVFNKKQ